MRTRMALAAVAAVWSGLAWGQISDIKGTSQTTFDIGVGSGKLTLTNAAGVLSLSSGLTVTGGTIDLSGGSASATKVTNLNADQTDGLSLVANANGGVVYQSSGTAFSATGAGTTGQFLISGGSGAPTWAGLASANIFVGNGSNIPTAVSMSGDATLSSAGALTIANSAVTTAKIANANVTAAKLDSSLEDMIITASISAGAEAGDTITVTFQLKDANANNLSQIALCHVTISDSSSALTATAQSPTLAFTSGASWSTVTANKKEIAYTTSGGALVFTVNITGAVTLYAHVSVGGKTWTATLAFS